MEDTAQPEIEKSHDSLELLYPELEIKNREILSELREFSIDVLNAYHDLRHKFKDTNIYQQGLEFIAEHSMSQLIQMPKTNSPFVKKDMNPYGHDAKVWTGYYKLQLDMVLSLEHDLLDALILAYNQTKPFKVLLASDEFGSGSLREFINALQTKYFGKNNGPVEMPKSFRHTVNSKQYSYNPSLLIPNQVFRSMYEPANDETLGMFYLFGSKRVQQGTIANTHRDNLHIDHKSALLDCYKERADKTGTPNFVKPDRAYQAIKNYYLDIDDVLTLDGFDETEKTNVLPESGEWLLNPNVEPIWNYFGRNTSAKLNGLDLTSYPQLSLLLEKVTSRSGNTLPLRAVNSSAQKVSDGPKSFEVKEDFSNLTTSKIDDDGGCRRALDNFHSVETQQNIYDNRSNDKIKLRQLKDLLPRWERKCWLKQQ